MCLSSEAFVVVLPTASARAASDAIDRVRTALVAAQQRAGTPPFTVSFGVAGASPHALFVDVLARADALLLRAKRNGRNRTVTDADAPDPVAADGPRQTLPSASP